jgi:hypothetical protein
MDVVGRTMRTKLGAIAALKAAVRTMKAHAGGATSPKRWTLLLMVMLILQRRLLLVLLQEWSMQLVLLLALLQWWIPLMLLLRECSGLSMLPQECPLLMIMLLF